jgi:hypothetical protein
MENGRFTGADRFFLRDTGLPERSLTLQKRQDYTRPIIYEMPVSGVDAGFPLSSPVPLTTSLTTNGFPGSTGVERPG